MVSSIWQETHCVNSSLSNAAAIQLDRLRLRPMESTQSYNRDHPDIQNARHMDLTPGDDGRWVAVYLGVRPVFEAKPVNGTMGMPTHLGRESFMAPVDWVG